MQGGGYWVTFPEYGNSALVTLGEIQLLDTKVLLLTSHNLIDSITSSHSHSYLVSSVVMPVRVHDST
jgi:hypothetical protein